MIIVAGSDFVNFGKVVLVGNSFVHVARDRTEPDADSGSGMTEEIVDAAKQL